MPKRVTLKEVAATAEVSYQTVSKVLNGQMQVSKETEARIWSAVKVLGYHPDFKARNLRMQRSGMIGYSWAPRPADQVNTILDQFLRSMMDAAERAGYHVLPFPHRDPQKQIAGYEELIKSGRVDGFVLSSVEFDDPRIAFLLEQNFPFVAFGRSNADWDIPYVDVDGAAGLRMATEHLIALGHRRIAVLAWPEGSRVGENRMEGYYAALQAAGIAVEEKMIARGEGRVGFGWVATLRWLERAPEDRPTAIVALNDAMAIGAMRAGEEKGLRVGIDLAIAGFDDSPMVQYLSPPLTSVQQPIWQVGQQIVRILVGILNDEATADRQILLPPRLIVRGSTDPRSSSGDESTNEPA